MKNIPMQPAKLTKWAAAGFIAFFLTACGGSGSDDPPAVSIPDDFVPVEPAPEEPGNGDDPVESVSFVIFEDQENRNPNWVAWDCCGGTVPDIVEDDDPEHGDAVRFTVGSTPTVMGFASRTNEDVGAPEAEPFDARDLANSGGTLSFDLKMISSPGDTPWLLKLESGAANSSVEVDISTANEGHEAPELNTWLTYTFNVSDLALAGASTNLDISQIDIVLVNPLWDTGDGAEYLLDNVKFEGEASAPPPEPVSFVIFEDQENRNPNWVAWDCCGGTVPDIVEDDDPEHGDAVRFTVGSTPTVMGFASRTNEDVGAPEAEPFDARDLANSGGTLSFDLKMISSPGDTPWLLKLESGAANSSVEVDISTANEGHEAPELNTWLTYTFNVSDLALAGASTNLDISQIDIVLVNPLWDTGDGAEYLLDNVKFEDG